MLDKLDRELITQLQKSGRQSYVELAQSLGYSERTIRNRVKSLLDKEYIKVTAVPNLEALGYNFMGIVGVQIQLATIKSIVQELIKHPNVCYLANVTGRYDFILIIRARSSREFANFMEGVVSVIPGIIRTETFVNLHIYKGELIGFDIEQLLNKLNTHFPA